MSTPVNISMNFRTRIAVLVAAVGALLVMGGGAHAQSFDRLFVNAPFWVEGERIETPATLTVEGRRFDRPWQEMSRERPFAVTSPLVKFLRALESQDMDTLRDLAHPDYLGDVSLNFELDIQSYLSTWPDISNPRVFAAFAFGDQVIFAIRADYGDYVVVPLFPFRQTETGEWKFAPAQDTLTHVLLANWSTEVSSRLSAGGELDAHFQSAPASDSLYVSPVEAREGQYELPLLTFNGVAPGEVAAGSRLARAISFVEETQGLLAEGDVSGFVGQYTAESAEYLRAYVASAPEAHTEIIEFATARPLFLVDLGDVVGVYFLRNEATIDLVFLSDLRGEFKFINASSVNITSNAFLTPMMLQGAMSEPPFGGLRLGE